MRLKGLVKSFGVVVLAFCGFNGSAHAGLIVSKIEVTNSIGTWLQVSEVIAWGTTSGSDQALASAGATAVMVGSGSYPGACGGLNDASCAIDGVGVTVWNALAHDNPIGGTLRITWLAPVELDWIEVQGRTDCCSNRDVYDIELFDALGQSVRLITGADATGPSHSTGAINVPAPGTLVLLGLGLVGIGYRRRSARH